MGITLPLNGAILEDQTHAMGKTRHLHLLRLTAGACITPKVSAADAADYDETIALGLVTSVSQTLGDDCRIEPVSVHGCNRQVSVNRQTCWLEPYPGVSVQYGAGGGGLTRAPDFSVDSLKPAAPIYRPR